VDKLCCAVACSVFSILLWMRAIFSWLVFTCRRIIRKPCTTRRFLATRTRGVFGKDHNHG
jgi:hypothetical protein